MSKENMRRNIVEKKNNSTREKEKLSSTQNLLSKHLKKVYPVGIHKTSSLLSLSSLSLTLSHNSSGSFTDSSSTLEQTISSALQLIAPSPTRSPSPSPTPARRDLPAAKTSTHGLVPQPSLDPSIGEDGLRRCNWITKNSDKLYVQFHDECWGVPVYDDNQLFELLSLCGMLMDYNWTEILKRKNLF
ncbi:hypothetical protein M8C21_006043, partial [Ambrosia artemisiifolia]